MRSAGFHPQFHPHACCVGRTESCCTECRHESCESGPDSTCSSVMRMRCGTHGRLECRRSRTPFPYRAPYCSLPPPPASQTRAQTRRLRRPRPRAKKHGPGGRQEGERKWHLRRGRLQQRLPVPRHVLALEAHELHAGRAVAHQRRVVPCGDDRHAARQPHPARQPESARAVRVARPVCHLLHDALKDLRPIRLVRGEGCGVSD